MDPKCNGPVSLRALSWLMLLPMPPAAAVPAAAEDPAGKGAVSQAGG
jgi:hypothetical protein